ncbi:MAG: ISAzo13 family transposase [Deltaproteobacteria bacterium]|nr:ISAzo13 family transposase [Deltaproteobacteria bacterium]
MGSRYPEREADVRARYERIAPTLDERSRRLFAANEAIQFGYGGRDAVERATGLSKNAVRRGIAELGALDELGPPPGRQRKAGGGRKLSEVKDPGLVPALRGLVEPATRGDPESPLLYTSKSAAKLAKELRAEGHPVSPDTVARILKDEGFTLQAPRKVLEGDDHADRDAQFQWISEEVAGFMEAGQPVISVDTKKKELVGEYANRGREWHPKGDGPEVLTYDFPNGVPKAVPYGVYDLARNDGWVSVGISSDTAEFATATIRRWWMNMGKQAYPDAKALLVTADCGGSNGYRLRLWLLCLQELADDIGLAITVAHFPPGTSKWNKIEHRLFSLITMNWRGRPLVSYETIVQLIGSTTSTTGLTVRCELDEGTYEKGLRVSDEELNAVQVERWEFHGEWNYTVYPKRT